MKFRFVLAAVVPMLMLSGCTKCSEDKPMEKAPDATMAEPTPAVSANPAAAPDAAAAPEAGSEQQGPPDESMPMDDDKGKTEGQAK